MPPAAKPPTCAGCPLSLTGRGWVPPDGPPDSLIQFVGEAAGVNEADQGKPFVGQAGAFLNRSFGLLGDNRERYRVGNVLCCQPPKDWLDGAPWEDSSILHCQTNRFLKLYGYSPKVYITLGKIATRTVLKEILHQDYSGKMNNWQSYVIGESFPYVIPSFHPAFMLRGNQKLLSCLVYAIKQAQEIAVNGFSRKPVSLIIDPDPEWFLAWSTTIDEEVWLAVDIETLTKAEEEDEAISGGDIVRVNFSTNPDQGITVPWDARYLPGIMRLLKVPCVKVFWNERFDVPILASHSMAPSGPIVDAMWAWHMLQSALPRGLGFAAPYYSDLPPWKHLSQDNPGHYAAMDAVQTIRVMFGVAEDLRKAGQWESFLRHVVKLDNRVIHPMEDVGLKLDPGRLKEFHTKLADESSSLLTAIQQSVPDHLRPLAGGWKTPQPLSFPRTVRKLVPCCTDCGAEDVTLKHKCKAGER